MTEQEAKQWLYNNTPIAIKPKVRHKYTFVNPFSSVHAFDTVISELAKKMSETFIEIKQQ